jgi:phage shock protein A
MLQLVHAFGPRGCKPYVCCFIPQVLETQLQARRQHELELEQQVAELTARVAQLSGQMDSAEAASKQSTNLERQVRHSCGTHCALETAYVELD